MSLLVSRLLSIPPVLLGVSLCTFFVFEVLPGDAAEQLLGADATAEQVERLRAQLDLNGPAWERYVGWISGALKGDFGESLTSGLPVLHLIADRVPVTVQLLGYAMIIALGPALGAALLAARRPERSMDRMMTVLNLVSLSVPHYVLAFFLVYLFAVTLPVLPSVGYAPLSEGVSRNVSSLTLPALSIALPLFGFYAQFLRRDLVEQIEGEGYVVTAAAKGVGPWGILVRHALRNSLFGLLAVLGVHAGTLIGAAVVVEQIFALPGVGQLLLQAVHARDVTVVEAVVLLIAVTTVMANLVVDLLYTVLDPRVRYRDR